MGLELVRVVRASHKTTWGVCGESVDALAVVAFAGETSGVEDGEKKEGENLELLAVEGTLTERDKTHDSEQEPGKDMADQDYRVSASQLGSD